MKELWPLGIKKVSYCLLTQLDKYAQTWLSHYLLPEGATCAHTLLLLKYKGRRHYTTHRYSLDVRIEYGDF